MKKTKKNKNSMPYKQETTQQDKAATESKPLLDVQSFLPIKEIKDGMIITTDNRYVKIIEVHPINFALKSVEEQENIIGFFAGWLKIAPIKMQFKIVTRKADSEKILQNVREASEGNVSGKSAELAENYMQFIRDISGSEALTRRFFIVIEYEAARANKKNKIEDISYELEYAAAKIRNGLQACGNEVVIPDNEDYFLAETLYLFYNKKSCAKEAFHERIMRVTQDTMKYMGLTDEDDYPDIPIVDYIAPRGIDFTHPDYFICDGLYYSIMLIKRDGYPTAVNAGWMSMLVETSDGVDVDVIMTKEDKANVKNKVSLKLKLNRIKASGRSDIDTDFEEIEGAIQSAQYIKQCLASGEDLYTVNTFITVCADTREELGRRIENLNDFLFSNDMGVKIIKYRLESAFQVTSPLLIPQKELMDFGARNIMTGGLSSMYPFTSCEICDENGIVLGINRRYSSLVNLDIFNTKKYKNANIAILGTSGSGKTYTELTMALRMRIQGIQTFIISPDKAHEFRRASAHIDGSYIRISPGSTSCINIMEIRPVENPIAEYLDESDGAEMDSWLSQKTTQLLTFFHLLINDLTNEEEQMVDEAIIKTYNKFGITNNNQSLYHPVTKQLRAMPIIGDLHAVLREKAETRRVANILGRFVSGSAQSFNQQTNVDLDNKFIVFDLQELTGTLKAIGMFIVMDFLWTRIKENRTDRKAIFIDEGWQLIGASADTRAADFVYRIFKIIRGYGGSAIFATQDISDLFAFQDGKYGKAIISNSKIKIVLGLEPQEANAVKEVLHLTNSEVRNITNFSQGEGLICANNNKVPVLIRASYLEDQLITTDPAQLKNMVAERKREMAEQAAKQHILAKRNQQNSGNKKPPQHAVDSMTTEVFDELDTSTIADKTWEQESQNDVEVAASMYALEVEAAAIKRTREGTNQQYEQGILTTNTRNPDEVYMTNELEADHIEQTKSVVFTEKQTNVQANNIEAYDEDPYAEEAIPTGYNRAIGTRSEYRKGMTYELGDDLPEEF